MQLAVGLVQAQPMCNGCVNVQGFGRNAAPLGPWHVGQCAHIVGAVGQLDQDDPHITGHRQQHLAKRLSLVFFAGVELQFVQLGQSVDQLCHRRAKALNQLGFGHAAVFQRVMQQRRHQGLSIDFPFRTLGCDSNGVGDVGFAVVAQLTQMRLICKAVGLPNFFQILW